MTQAYWEADGADLGGAPSNITYTQPWDPFDSVTIVSSSLDPDFSYAMELDKTSTPDTNRTIFEITDIDGTSLADSADVEIYLVMDIQNARATHIGAGLRTSGSSGSETGVIGRSREIDDAGDIFELNSGSFNALDTNQSQWTIDDPVAIKLRVNSSDEVQLKIWVYGTTEPSYSTAQTTTITASGGFGIYTDDLRDAVNVLAIGIGTAGDAAPTAPVSGGTEYTQYIAGSCTSSGALNRGVSANIVGQITAAGSAAKGIVLGTAYAGSITATGSLSKSLVFLQSVAGSVTSTGAVAKSVLKNLSGAVTLSGAVNKLISVTRTGSVTATGAATKAYTTIQSIAGQITASSTLATLKGIAVFITTRVRKLYYNYIGRR